MSNTAQEKNFRNMIENQPDLICQWSLDGKLSYVNNAYCEFFGKTKDELIGGSHFDNILPDDCKKLIAHAKSFSEKKNNIRIILRIINTYGEMRWYQFNDHYQFIEEVNQGQIFSTGRDITELINTENELQKRINYEQLITHLSINFINAPPEDIDNHINEVLKQMGKLSGVDRSYVFTLDQGKNTISNIYEWCNDGIEPQIQNIQNMPYESLQWWMSHLFSFKTIRIPNVEKLPPEANEEKAIFLEQNIKSLLNVPLVNAGRLLGFLGFDSVKRLRDWTDAEATLLRILGGIIGSAILQKKNQQELDQRKIYLEKLNEITITSLSTNNTDEMLDVVANKMGEIINADFCSITLWDKKQNLFTIYTSNGVASRQHKNLKINPEEPSMSMSTLEAGRTLIAEDAVNSEYTNKQFVSQTKSKSLLGVPLITDDSKLGTIIYGFYETHHFTYEEITLAEQATYQIAQSLDKIRLLEQAQRNEQAAKRLYGAGAIVASTLKPQDAIERILDQLEKVVPFDSASVQIMRDGYLEIRAGKGWPNDFNPTGQRFPIPGDNPYNVVVQSRKPFVLNDSSIQSLISDDPAFANIRSWLGIPLIFHDEVIGLLTLNHPQSGFYNDDWLIELVTAFADYVAISLENTRLYTEEHLRATELDALRETTADITKELGLENLLYAILERATTLLNATGGELGLIDEHGDRIQILVSYKMGPQKGMDSFGAGEGLMGYVIQTRQIEMIENYQEWEGRLETYEDNPIHAAIAAPLMIGDRLLGVIGIMNSDRQRHFSHSNKDLMHLFAQQAAIAVENAKLFEEKEYQARIDFTTGIYNRRGLLELGKRELDRAHRYDRPLAALMIDIDYFKKVNDTYGHPIGDLVLKELAGILEENIRTIDVLGRYGGEEFVILLPETSPESALEIAERLRGAVTKHTFTPEALKIKITISIGLAFSIGGENGLDDLIKRADDAMYESKVSGRNRTSVNESA